MLRECVADGGVGSADQRGFGRDVDRLTGGSHFQLHIECRRDVLTCSTTCSWVAFAKPGLVTVNVYSPGIIWRN